MEKILFRGKELKTGKWAYGNYYYESKANQQYITWNGKDALGNFGDRYHPVTNVVIDETTVGQYTGLKDKNGKRIFEGDILRNSRNDLFVVRYICGGFDCEPIKEFYKQPKISWNTLGELQNASWVEDNNEVIGNIYDNPNLLPMETK